LNFEFSKFSWEIAKWALQIKCYNHSQLVRVKRVVLGVVPNKQFSQILANSQPKPKAFRSLNNFWTPPHPPARPFCYVHCKGTCKHMCQLLLLLLEGHVSTRMWHTTRDLKPLRGLFNSLHLRGGKKKTMYSCGAI